MWKRRMLAREKRIRERKRPKPAVEEKPAEEKLRPVAAVIEAMPIGVIVHDLEGKVLQANAASEKMFGYKREEEIGKSVIDLVAEEDRPRALESMLKGLREGFTRGFECIGVRKDGSKIQILIDSTLMKDSEGNPSSVVISVSDITELKRAWGEIERAYKELAVLERARAFTFILFKDVFEPLLKACKPETVAKVGGTLRDVSKRVPIAASVKIANSGSISFDEASIREALAGSSPSETLGEVAAAFSEIMDACYPVIRADAGEQKATEIFSDLFRMSKATPYKPDLLKIVPEGIELPGLVHRPLEPSKCYLVEESKADQAFSMFEDMLAYEFPGLCISTRHPADVKSEHGFRGRVTVFWLSKTERDYAVSPSNLGILRDRISTFVSHEENAVVLLDGLEYLITMNGFDLMLKFLHDVRESITLNRARLIVPIAPGTLEAKQLELLERYTEVIEVVEEEK